MIKPVMKYSNKYQRERMLLSLPADLFKLPLFDSNVIPLIFAYGDNVKPEMDRYYSSTQILNYYPSFNSIVIKEFSDEYSSYTVSFCESSLQLAFRLCLDLCFFENKRNRHDYLNKLLNIISYLLTLCRGYDYSFESGRGSDLRNHEEISNRRDSLRKNYLDVKYMSEFIEFVLQR